MVEQQTYYALQTVQLVTATTLETLGRQMDEVKYPVMHLHRKHC